MFRNTLLAAFTCLILSLANSAFAIDKDTAKRQGLIGETANGYLASPTGSASSEVRALIEQINAKRRAAYQNSAAKAGVSRSVIEQRIAERLRSRAVSGDYLQDASGRWYQK